MILATPLMKLLGRCKPPSEDGRMLGEQFDQELWGPIEATPLTYEELRSCYEESRIHWTEVADPDDWTPIGKPVPEYLGKFVKEERSVS